MTGKHVTVHSPTVFSKADMIEHGYWLELRRTIESEWIQLRAVAAGKLSADKILWFFFVNVDYLKYEKQNEIQRYSLFIFKEEKINLKYKLKWMDELEIF